MLENDEADRRGHLYDKAQTSYLFTLNGDVVVDAAIKVFFVLNQRYVWRLFEWSIDLGNRMCLFAVA